MRARPEWTSAAGWTRASAIAALQGWAEREGRRPTERAWHPAPEGTPSVHVVLTLFGSWRAAMREARLGDRGRGGVRDYDPAAECANPHCTEPRGQRSLHGRCYTCGRYVARTGRDRVPGANGRAPLPQRWTREAIIAKAREWAQTYGEPPAVPDWTPYFARKVLHDDVRARRHEEGDWPSSTVVCKRFGSWNAMIEAAGWEPRPSFGGRGNSARRRAG